MAASELEKHRRRWEENPKGLTFAPYADALRKSGAAEEALSVLRAGLEFHPDYLPANIVLGRTYLDLGDDGAAETAFARVLELDPENVIALKALADVCERATRWDDAERWLGLLLGVDRWNDGAREQMLRVQEARTAAPAALVAAGASEATAAAATELEAPAASDLPAASVGAPPAARQDSSAPSQDDHVRLEAAAGEIELEASAFEAPSIGHRSDVVPDGFEAAVNVTDAQAIDAVSPLAGLVSNAYKAEALPSPFEAPAPEAGLEVELEAESPAILAPTAGAAEFAVDDAAASLGASIIEEPVAELVADGESADAPDWAEIGSGEFVPAMFTDDVTPEMPSASAPTIMDDAEIEVAVEVDSPLSAAPLEEMPEPDVAAEQADAVPSAVEVESAVDVEPLAIVLDDAAAADLTLPDLETTSFDPVGADAFAMSSVIAEPELPPLVTAPESLASAAAEEMAPVVASPEMSPVVATPEMVMVAAEPEPPSVPAAREPAPPAEPWACCDWSAEPTVEVDPSVLAALGPQTVAPAVPALAPAPVVEPVEITDPWRCADWTADPEVPVDDAIVAALGPARAPTAATVEAVAPVIVAAAPEAAVSATDVVTASPEPAPADVAVPTEPLDVPSDEDAAAAPPDFAAPVLVTAAMAMLYESQGHHGDALRVYRELELREPGTHAARIAALEAQLAASVPAPPVFAARATGGRSVREFLQGTIRGAPAALLSPRALPSEGPALRRAEDDVSLGRIFGEESGGAATAARPLSVAARPQASMDEFYGGAPAAPSSSDDLEQFHAWLQGLKT